MTMRLSHSDQSFDDTDFASSRPSILVWLGQMVAVVLLAVLWLIIAGCYAKFAVLPGVIYAVVVLIAFASIQIAPAFRLRWTIRASLRAPTSRQSGFALAAVGGNFLAGTLWLTAFKLEPGSTSTGLLPAQVYVGVFLFPIIEEVAFRGWMQQVGERRLPPIAAMFLTAMLFAAFHSYGDWLPRINDGLIFGAALLATRSLWLTIGMHMLINLLIVLASQWGWLNQYMATIATIHPVWLKPSALIMSGAITITALAVAIGSRSPADDHRVAGKRNDSV